MCTGQGHCSGDQRRLAALVGRLRQLRCCHRPESVLGVDPIDALLFYCREGIGFDVGPRSAAVLLVPLTNCSQPARGRIARRNLIAYGVILILVDAAPRRAFGGLLTDAWRGGRNRALSDGVNRVSRWFGCLRAVDDLSVFFGVVRPARTRDPRPATARTAQARHLFEPSSGLIRRPQGQPRLEGRDSHGQPPHCLARLGIGTHVSDRTAFSEVSVLENVIAGTGVLLCRAEPRDGRIRARRPGGDDPASSWPRVSGAGRAICRIPDKEALEIRARARHPKRLLRPDEVMAVADAAEIDDIMLILATRRERPSQMLIGENRDARDHVAVATVSSVMATGARSLEGRRRSVAADRP